MTSAADLFALQEIDLQRDARRAIIADIDARLGETEELLDAREIVEDTEAALARLKRRQRESDAQIQDLEAKINPLNTRLYDGSVRNPKELTDLQKELESLIARRSAMDDQGLALMDSVEAATRNLEVARRELASVEADWQASQEELARNRARAETEHATLDVQRENATRGMDPVALSRYEALRISRQGRAVSRIERGVCQGCRITLPTHLTQRVRTGLELVNCPSCERLLVSG